MWLSSIRRSIPLVCFISLLFSEISGDLSVCALRISFQVDNDESTTGNGQYLLESNGIDCDRYTIDPVPHDRSYFESQLKAVDGYFNDVSYGKFGIDLALSSVYPIEDDSTYSLSNTMNYSILTIKMRFKMNALQIYFMMRFLKHTKSIKLIFHLMIL